MEFDAVDGFVAAQVQVAGTLAQLPLRRGGQGGELAVLAGGDHVHLCGVLARFLGRLLAPAAGHHKIDRPGTREVQRHDGVFGQATALHEQHLELRRDGQQLAQVGLGLFADGDEFLAPVAHLHHAHAAAMPVQHFGGGLFQNFGRNGSRAGREVVGALHGLNKKRCQRPSIERKQL
jgi:hypothetical protein